MRVGHGCDRALKLGSGAIGFLQADFLPTVNKDSVWNRARQLVSYFDSWAATVWAAVWAGVRAMAIRADRNAKFCAGMRNWGFKRRMACAK